MQLQVKCTLNQEIRPIRLKVLVLRYPNLFVKKKAGSICKIRGYTEIDFREEISPGMSVGGVSVGGFVSRIMTIQCN